MKNMVDCKRLGLTLGVFFALLHAIWAVLIGFGVGQRTLNWIMPLHFIDMACGLLPFSWGSAIMLVVLAFVGGFVMGWLLGYIWNYFGKK